MASEVPVPNLSDLLLRVKRRMAMPVELHDQGAARMQRESVLLATAARYGARTTDFAVTPPTGFDPDAAALFEAIVESAFLVANADGQFDATEREVFTSVVVEASQRRVPERQVNAIVLDLATQLAEDGLELRLQRLGRAIVRAGDRREALRIAALLAQASAGVSGVERQVLDRLASVWELSSGAVDDALSEAASALGDAGCG
jgi:tellurite resistance protein